MLHSIIIPHRNRNRQVYQTTLSVDRSALAAGITDYEVIIVDHSSLQHPPTPIPGRVVRVLEPYGTLNKCRLLNIGIEAARGDILSFLDADMLVGKGWMAATQTALATEHPPTRLAYRVRQLKVSDQAHQNTELVLNALERCLWSNDKRDVLAMWFSEYGHFTRGFEAYGQPESGNKPRVRTPVFGNSQFSIRRDVLGDLRFDEYYVGAGYEDIAMAWNIWKHFGDDYRGAILTGPRHALLHIWHGARVEEPGSDWSPPGSSRRGEERYFKMKEDFDGDVQEEAAGN